MGKHKKHKSERRERADSPDPARSGLKLILKVGSQGTPEHPSDWAYPGVAPGLIPGSYSITPEEAAALYASGEHTHFHRSHHKKSKKKKKKKDKSKDREHKHRHHHKEKKRKRAESGQEDEGGLLSEAGSPGPMLPIGSPSGRELRQCVLRQRLEKSVLQRGLENVLSAFEKRDPQQFFAWPVTDNIAPGYSAIITSPMDFSTMRQKVEDNLYANLNEFIDDFKLMCTNAMQYNHADTVYYKASKKLMHAGLRLVQPDRIGWLLALVPELCSRDLGFEITPELQQQHRSHPSHHLDTDHEDGDGPAEGVAKKRMPPTKFEAVPDELTPEEILARTQAAAREAKVKVVKKGGPKMGFLRQRKDGSTQINILVGGDGVVPGTRKRPVLLGALTGKLQEGTSQLQGFREDRRNVAKPVKPLYYGNFGSYAPSFDSAFANLSKEESDLVYQTYGSDHAVQYAESILDFAKDCDYTLHMVDNLLDLLTGGDHGKTKKVLDEKKMLREEEEAIKTVLETPKPPVVPADSGVKIDVDDLRSLSSLGINTDFLDEMADDIRTTEDYREMQERLNSTSQLLDKLQKTQLQRLSSTLPVNLNNMPQPSEEELALADSVTDNLADMAKRVNPGDIASVQGIHKAMGVSIPDIDVPASEVPDLESELRQFLESEPNLAQSPLRDDKTIEEILME